MSIIQAKDIQLVAIDEIKLNGKNRNRHPAEQIERLAKIIEYQGFRNPLIVSNRTGLVVAGHGRFEAAKKLGMVEVPVIFQDFENADQEYSAMVSDNAVAAWSDLDLSGINTDLADLGPDFDLEFLGIKGFKIDHIPEVENTSVEFEAGQFDNFQHECPKCGFEFNDDKS